VIRQQDPRRGDPIGVQDWRELFPFDAVLSSVRLGWVGLEAARCRAERVFELNPPAITYHWLVLFLRPPEELNLQYEGVKRHVPPPAGAISLVPAGSRAQLRWTGPRDLLAIYLESGLVAQVAAATFDLDPSRLTVPPLDSLELPRLRAILRAVDAELTAGGAGGRLAAESLANVLAVHLIRHVLTPRSLSRGRDGKLPRGRLRAVVEYIEEHLDSGPSLEQLAAVARLSAFHFARQFKQATGMPPHQYVIMRRVERAKQLLQTGSDLSLAEVAVCAGFSDQSQFSHHFKRLVGVTAGQFRMSARIGYETASPCKKPVSNPPYHSA
jgi:AraC family transcriptional regulator